MNSSKETELQTSCSTPVRDMAASVTNKIISVTVYTTQLGMSDVRLEKRKSSPGVLTIPLLVKLFWVCFTQQIFTEPGKYLDSGLGSYEDD